MGIAIALVGLVILSVLQTWMRQRQRTRGRQLMRAGYRSWQQRLPLPVVLVIGVAAGAVFGALEYELLTSRKTIVGWLLATVIGAVLFAAVMLRFRARGRHYDQLAAEGQAGEPTTDRTVAQARLNEEP